MGDHHFGSRSELCLGCDLGRAEVVDGGPAANSCPSICTLINDEHEGILAVISAPDRLVISNGEGVMLRLGAQGARALVFAARGVG